jgi:hypothetical protein
VREEPVTELDLGGWDDFASVDPEQGPVLAERLRVVADSLKAEFQGLSRSDAERLVLIAAVEVLSSASVVHFVPTFVERRARQRLSNGLNNSHSAPAAEAPESPATAADASPQTAPAPPSAEPPTPAAAPPAQPWSGAFYASEAKRLLERARDLRAADLAKVRSSGRA